MLFRKKKKDFEIEIVEVPEEEEIEAFCLSEEDDEAEEKALLAEVYEMKRDTFPSSDCDTDISYYVFAPKRVKPRAIIQLVHGFCDHILRYEYLAELLCREGFILCGGDHVGHGYTAENRDELGFTVSGGGSAYIVKDTHRLTRIIKREYPDLPVILLGQGMGSVIARLYMRHYDRDIFAAVLVGTDGGAINARLCKKLSQIVISERGERERCELLSKFAFIKYNKKFKKEKSPFSWLTSDEEQREEWEDDGLCAFVPTARMMYDTFDMLLAANRDEWTDKIEKDLPVLIISGECDPFGDYGKGVRALYRKMKRAGVRDITLRLYNDGRHELLFEKNKEVVVKNTLDWIEDRLEERINEA